MKKWKALTCLLSLANIKMTHKSWSGDRWVWRNWEDQLLDCGMSPEPRARSRQRWRQTHSRSLPPIPQTECGNLLLQCQKSSFCYNIENRFKRKPFVDSSDCGGKWTESTETRQSITLLRSFKKRRKENLPTVRQCPNFLSWSKSDDVAHQVSPGWSASGRQPWCQLPLYLKGKSQGPPKEFPPVVWITAEEDRQRRGTFYSFTVQTQN